MVAKTFWMNRIYSPQIISLPYSVQRKCKSLKHNFAEKIKQKEGYYSRNRIENDNNVIKSFNLLPSIVYCYRCAQFYPPFLVAFYI